VNENFCQSTLHELYDTQDRKVNSNSADESYNRNIRMGIYELDFRSVGYLNAPRLVQKTIKPFEIVKGSPGIILQLSRTAAV
jgi:hypothetical protein